MTFNIVFIDRFEFHYTPAVIEGIESYPEQYFSYGENWEQGSFVRVKWKNQIRDSICRTTLWSEKMYSDHWSKSLKMVQSGHQNTVFLINISPCTDETAADMNRWYYVHQNETGQYNLFYGEYWNSQWQDDFNEAFSLNSLSKRCPELMHNELLFLEAQFSLKDLQDIKWG